MDTLFIDYAVKHRQDIEWQLWAKNILIEMRDRLPFESNCFHVSLDEQLLFVYSYYTNDD
jgi:hypothetical protein